MTQSAFECLSTAEQADYLSQSGKCLFSRMYGCYFVNVFLLQNFTVGAWYDTSLCYVEKTTIQPNSSLPDLKCTDYFTLRHIHFTSTFTVN